MLTALDQVPNRHQNRADMIRMLLFTGCRKGEILHLWWDEVATATLTLTDSKTGPRTVWLGAAASAVIER